jgi:hypothetical protein
MNCGEAWRHLLVSGVPVPAAIFLTDLLLHGDQPVLAVFRACGWMYRLSLGSPPSPARDGRIGSKRSTVASSASTMTFANSFVRSAVRPRIIANDTLMTFRVQGCAMWTYMNTAFFLARSGVAGGCRTERTPLRPALPMVYSSITVHTACITTTPNSPCRTPT